MPLFAPLEHGDKGAVYVKAFFFLVSLGDLRRDQWISMKLTVRCCKYLRSIVFRRYSRNSFFKINIVVQISNGEAYAYHGNRIDQQHVILIRRECGNSYDMAFKTCKLDASRVFASSYIQPGKVNVVSLMVIDNIRTIRF